MPASRPIVVLAASVLLLAGCGRDEARTGASSAESHAPGTTLAAVPGACGSYTPGTPGVIRTFCDGRAVVKITVAGVDHVLHGGTCQQAGGMFVLNLGVVANADLGGPKPDYVGLTVPMTTGHFTNAILSVTVKGRSYALTGNSGDLNPPSGSFQGVAASDGTDVAGSFTC